MDLTVLAVPDCPNVMLLEERLAQVLEGRLDVTVCRQVIADQEEAARRGMHGSLTNARDHLLRSCELLHHSLNR